MQRIPLHRESGRRKSYLGGEVSQSLLTTQEPEHSALQGDLVVQILGL